jgi:hypothetical protein
LVASHPIAPLTAHAGGVPQTSVPGTPTPTTSDTPPNAEPTEPSEAAEPSESSEPTEPVEVAEPPEPTPAVTVDLKLTGELQLEATWGLELALAVAAAGVAAVEGRRSRLIRWVAAIVVALLLVFLFAGISRSVSAGILPWPWFVILLALAIGLASYLLRKAFQRPRQNTNKGGSNPVTSNPPTSSKQTADEIAPSPDRLQLQLERINYLAIGIALVLIAVGFVTGVGAVSMNHPQTLTRVLAVSSLGVLAASIALGVLLSIPPVGTSNQRIQTRSPESVGDNDRVEERTPSTEGQEARTWHVTMIRLNLSFFVLGVVLFAAVPISEYALAAP